MFNYIFFNYLTINEGGRRLNREVLNIYLYLISNKGDLLEGGGGGGVGGLFQLGLNSYIRLSIFT